MQFTVFNLQLFPYHLAEYVCRVMRVSPFRYYCDMIFEVMKNGTWLFFSICHMILLKGSAISLVVLFGYIRRRCST